MNTQREAGKEEPDKASESAVTRPPSPRCGPGRDAFHISTTSSTVRFADASFLDAQMAVTTCVATTSSGISPRTANRHAPQR
ncbi:hypothetical protein ACIBSV_20090 [Embleya sp. NPDC050154]|uniref:hypothetical protein n=1 Tax=unclassified Embleya TaxID=2699296 RepID=UPI0037943942